MRGIRTCFACAHLFINALTNYDAIKFKYSLRFFFLLSLFWQVFMKMRYNSRQSWRKKLVIALQTKRKGRKIFHALLTLKWIMHFKKKDYKQKSSRKKGVTCLQAEMHKVNDKYSPTFSFRWYNFEICKWLCIINYVCLITHSAFDMFLLGSGST